MKLWFCHLDPQKATEVFFFSLTLSFMAGIWHYLKGRSHQDLVLLENLIKAMELIGSPLIVA